MDVKPQRLIEGYVCICFNNQFEEDFLDYQELLHSELLEITKCAPNVKYNRKI